MYELIFFFYILTISSLNLQFTITTTRMHQFCGCMKYLAPTCNFSSVIQYVATTLRQSRKFAEGRSSEVLFTFSALSLSISTNIFFLLSRLWNVAEVMYLPPQRMKVILSKQAHTARKTDSAFESIPVITYYIHRYLEMVGSLQTPGTTYKSNLASSTLLLNIAITFLNCFFFWSYWKEIEKLSFQSLIRGIYCFLSMKMILDKRTSTHFFLH